MDLQRPPCAWGMRFIQFSAGLAILLSFSVLAGWCAGSPILVRWFRFSAAMQIDSALTLLLSGAALLSCACGWPRGSLVEILPLLYSLLTLAEHLLGPGHRMDWPLLPPPAADLTAGRMARVTAACFVLLGIGILFLSQASRTPIHSLFAALSSSCVVAAASVVLLSFVVGRGVPRELYFAMAAPTTAGLIILGSGIFALAWHQGTVRERLVPHWLATIAGCAASTAMVVLWTGALAEESRQLTYSTRLATQRIRERLCVQLRTRSTALRNASSRWQRTALRPANAMEFRQEIVDHPSLKGLRFVQRLTPSLHIIWSLTAADRIPLWRESEARPEIEQFLQAVKGQQQPLCSRPFHLKEFGESIALAVPVVTNEQFSGWLLGVYDSSELIDGMLLEGGPKPNFGVAVYAGEEQLYLRNPGGSSGSQTTSQEKLLE